MLLPHFLGNRTVITKFMSWFGLLSFLEAAQVRSPS